LFYLPWIPRTDEGGEELTAPGQARLMGEAPVALAWIPGGYRTVPRDTGYTRDTDGGLRERANPRAGAEASGGARRYRRYPEHARRRGRGRPPSGGLGLAGWRLRAPRKRLRIQGIRYPGGAIERAGARY
jgi:hypothetical protein